MKRKLNKKELKGLESFFASVCDRANELANTLDPQLSGKGIFVQKLDALQRIASEGKVLARIEQGEEF